MVLPTIVQIAADHTDERSHSGAGGHHEVVVNLLVHGEYTLSPGPDGHVVTQLELPNQGSQFARRDPLPKYLQERFVGTRGNGVGPLYFSQPKGAKLAGLEIKRTLFRLQLENH